MHAMRPNLTFSGSPRAIAAAVAACAAFTAGARAPMEEFHSNSGNFWERYRSNPTYAPCRGLVDQHEQMTWQLRQLDQQAKQSVEPRRGELVQALNQLAARRHGVQDALFACVRQAASNRVPPQRPPSQQQPPSYQQAPAPQPPSNQAPSNSAPASPPFNDVYGSNSPPGGSGQRPPMGEEFGSNGRPTPPADRTARRPAPPSHATGSEHTPRPITRQFRLTAKSFIAHIGDKLGPTPRRPQDPVRADINFRLLAAQVDTSFSEDPHSENQDKGYRLYSHVGVLATCTAARLTHYEIGQVMHDVGTEPAHPLPGGIALHPEPMKIEVHRPRATTSSVEFGWFGKGRPPDLIEAAMTAGVARRDAHDIWHDVTARITCTADGPQINVQLRASHFPSHRVWVNNRLVLSLSQGPLSAVWVGDPRTGLVR